MEQAMENLAESVGPQRLELRLTNNVPRSVEKIVADAANLPLWQYLILVEELDKLIEGPAFRVPR